MLRRLEDRKAKQNGQAMKLQTIQLQAQPSQHQSASEKIMERVPKPLIHLSCPTELKWQVDKLTPMKLLTPRTHTQSAQGQLEQGQWVCRTNQLTSSSTSEKVAEWPNLNPSACQLRSGVVERRSTALMKQSCQVMT